MAGPRFAALALSASIFTTSAATAFAQTPPAAPSPAPAASGAPQPMQTVPPPQPQLTPMPGAPATPGAQVTPGAQTTPGVASRGVQGGTLPPPPVPVVLPAVPSVAPGFSAPVSAVPNGDLVGVQQQPFVGLALQDAIAMALQRNTDLALAQSNRRIANYQIVAAEGAYDVRFQLVPQYSHSVSPAVSSFQAGPGGGPVTQDTAGVTAALQGLTQQGGQYRFGVNGTRVNSNSTINSYNPFYETALQFSLTQPLARGRATDQTRLQLQLARNNASIAGDVALTQASNTMVQVSNAYYDLVAAWRNVAIQEEGLRNAQAQAASNARLAARGAVAPTDIVEANTQVNVFQDNVFAALQNVQRLQTQLKSLILANPGDPVWFANLVPTSAILQIPQEPSLDALINSAIANRPEIAQLRAQRANANSNLAFAQDQLRPQIDLGLNYTSNGFAGQPVNPANNPIFGLFGAQIAAIDALIARSNAQNPTLTPIPPISGSGLGSLPPNQTGGLGTAFQNAFDNRFPTYSAQLTFQVPFGNRTAKADYAIAQEQARQVAVQETAVLQRIRGESVNAIQGLREAQYRLVAARAAREAAQRVLLGEQRRFRAGTSTTFLVLQRQLDVANQELRELQAQTDLDKAIVELNRVSGGVFAQNGIDTSALGGSTLNALSPTQSVLPPASTATAPPVTRGSLPGTRRPL
ncbi:MAG: TolC family protein [Candidatus Eremiobacteraeota bacterium]|nr:TolC family protein [Candidatus Eremiobacteraeota bacterium]